MVYFTLLPIQLDPKGQIVPEKTENNRMNYLHFPTAHIFLNAWEELIFRR